MKRIGMLLLLVLVSSVLANSQEKYCFTIAPGRDTIVVYDADSNVVLLYGKDVFVYRQTPIEITGKKKEIVFSSPDGELGRVSSRKYRKIYLADGSMYILASGKMKLSYKKDGHVCASSSYTYSGAPYFAGKVDVEMSVDTDLNFIPFLFHGVLAHIRGMKEAEQLLWFNNILMLMD